MLALGQLLALPLTPKPSKSADVYACVAILSPEYICCSPSSLLSFLSLPLAMLRLLALLLALALQRLLLELCAVAVAVAGAP